MGSKGALRATGTASNLAYPSTDLFCIAGKLLCILAMTTDHPESQEKKVAKVQHFSLNNTYGGQLMKL